MLSITTKKQSDQEIIPPPKKPAYSSLIEESMSQPTWLKVLPFATVNIAVLAILAIVYIGSQASIESSKASIESSKAVTAQAAAIEHQANAVEHQAEAIERQTSIIEGMSEARARKKVELSTGNAALDMMIFIGGCIGIACMLRS